MKLSAILFLMLSLLARSGSAREPALTLSLRRDVDGSYAAVFRNAGAKAVFCPESLPFSLEVFDGGVWTPVAGRCGNVSLPIAVSEILSGSVFEEYLTVRDSMQNYAGRQIRVRVSFSYERGSRVAPPKFETLASSAVTFIPVPDGPNPFLRTFPKKANKAPEPTR